MTTAPTSPPRFEVQSVSLSEPALPPRVATALDVAVAALFAKQRSDRASDGQPMPGLHWCAELEGDSILSSEYLLMKVILSQESDPADLPRLRRIANHLRLTQRRNVPQEEGPGGWGQYPGSPPDLSASVKAYFALKLFGDHPDAPHMRAARDLILSRGGAGQCNTFSNFYLACLGQISWDACPAIPPEIVLLPRSSPFHMDRVAAWTRTMILPLAVCSALRPVRQLPHELGIDELFIDKAPAARTRLNKNWNKTLPISWSNFFLACDRALKLAQKHKALPLRQKALREAEAWLLKRIDPKTTEGLGAIFPPMVYIQVALKALGYDRSEPLLRQAERDLDAFMVDQPHPDPTLDHIHLQPCFSPVWDTGIALYALTEAGLTAPTDDRIAKACDWLLDRRVRMTGDWINNLRPKDRNITLVDEIPASSSNTRHSSLGTHDSLAATAWAFEYRNDWYPDVDDTAMVAKALWRAGDRPGQTRNRAAAKLAVRWLLAMQNDDGGWAAFDRTKDRRWMEAIPFADHNAMQDPSCADITGRTIEALITCGVPPADPAITSALRYLLSHQEPEGCWWGRWGCNYIYGTWQAMGGLHATGALAAGKHHPAATKAIDWLRSIQNADGGFGESANSYLDRSLMGRGPSTASQTAWALTTLLYVLPPTDPAVERAAAWLCDHQLAADKRPFERSRTSAPAATDPGSSDLAPLDFVSDRAGSWSEHFFTGTGFPRTFYLRYNLYRHYFPVMALARYQRRLAAT